LEPMIRHNPDATGCRIVTDELKPKNMKSKILHMRNGIVMITNQKRSGFIDDPEDNAFKEGIPCQTTHKILAPQGFRKEIITEAHNSTFAGHGGMIQDKRAIEARLLVAKHGKGHKGTHQPMQTMPNHNG
jgi:hypothetical protein